MANGGEGNVILSSQLHTFQLNPKKPREGGSKKTWVRRQSAIFYWVQFSTSKIHDFFRWQENIFPSVQPQPSTGYLTDQKAQVLQGQTCYQKKQFVISSSNVNNQVQSVQRGQQSFILKNSTEHSALLYIKTVSSQPLF